MSCASSVTSPVTVMVTVVLSPALRMPDAGDTVSLPTRLAGSVIDQPTGPPLAVSVSEPPSTGLSTTVFGYTVSVPARSVATTVVVAVTVWVLAGGYVDG